MRDKFLFVEEELNKELFERRAEIHATMLAILAKKHIFFLGEPGVAKSLLFDRLLLRINQENEDFFFRWLLTRFSAPEEIFGGPDIKVLKETGVYKRITKSKLPRASYAFLDEIFKANSAILNALLKIMNEGEFDNPGEDSKVPLRTIFAASNELPQSAELEAMADRLHIWLQVRRIQEPSNFVRMLDLKLDPEPKKILTVADIDAAHAEIDQVIIPDDLYDVMLDLKSHLEKENITPTDRKFHQTIDVIKAEAWLNGHAIAEVYDMKPLQHMMWRLPNDIDKVRNIVLSLTDQLDKEAMDLLDQFNISFSGLEKVLVNEDDPTKILAVARETLVKWDYTNKEYAELKKREKDLGRVCYTLKDVRNRLDSTITRIVQDGLNLGLDDVAELIGS